MLLKHFVLYGIPLLSFGFLSSNGVKAEVFAPFRPVGQIADISGSVGARFGEKVAVSGDIIAVVARDDNSLATDGGMVYLFNQDYEFVDAFGSPNPEDGGMFGFYITGVGDDRFLVSANRERGESGRAYMFSNTGEYISTFESPNHGSGNEFGGRVVLANDESLFIASWFERETDEDGPFLAGAVYQYDPLGRFLTRWGHPRIDNNREHCFGRSGTFVGDDLLLIGDACNFGPQNIRGAGAAFLFDLSGNLLRVLDNPAPTPLDSFGSSVASAADRILIGGLQIDDLDNGASTGAVYIYDTDGTLVTRVSDPEPRGGNWFGWNAGSMTLESGEEVFLVGSIFNSTSHTSAGKAFVIDREGNILQTLESPTPVPGENFGADFISFGNKLLVGAPKGSSSGEGNVWVFEQADLGDFDLNGTVDEFDLNILCGDLVSGEITKSWDITGESTIDHQDLTRFLELTTFVQGDTDFDGQVTFADFLDLSSNFGDPDATGWSDGNFNCNGHVDFGDFLLLSANFGQSATAQVPEPSVNHWFVLTLCCFLRRLFYPRFKECSQRSVTSHEEILW